MSDQPTLIILATSSMPDRSRTDSGLDSLTRPALPDFQKIAQTLDLGLEAGLPVVLVASRWVKQQCEVFAPEVACIETDVLNPPLAVNGEWVKAIALAVQASAQAPGWLIMPTPMPALKPDTLQTLQQYLCSHALVSLSHQMQQSYPLGLSAEFYSELVRLKSLVDLRRLLTRYPWMQVETDDPGVVPVESPFSPQEEQRPFEGFTSNGLRR